MRCILAPAFSLSLLVVVSTGVVAKSADPPYYLKKSTWHTTLLASRDEFVLYNVRELQRRGIEPGPWYAAGPFTAEKPFITSFGPEKETVSLTGTFDGGKVRWVQHSEWDDGRVVSLGPVRRSATYLYRTMTAVNETTVTGYLGSDDGIKVWLNGKPVFQHDIDRGCDRNQEIVSFSLAKGENRFLMKVTNGGGPTAFYFSLLDVNLDALWDLVNRDFPSAEERQEMSWERDDGIWEGSWTPGWRSALAQRYEAAVARMNRAMGITEPIQLDAATGEALLYAIRFQYLTVHRKQEVLRQEEMKALTLTPKPSLLPRVNGAKVFGVRPGAPFLYTIPATGRRPMDFSASGLPEGLSIEVSTGRITGTEGTPGRYDVVLHARNELGETERSFTVVVGEEIALTPPLGWNSWNCFAGDVDDAKVRMAADAMVSSGLINHGWTYINIDDCWMIKPGSNDSMLIGEQRDKDGMINSNKKFPDMKALSEYVHGKGLKLGIYSSPGPLTCAGYAASYQYERQDAVRFAEWGIDYLKYDWCSYGGIARDQSLPELKKPYAVMRAALDSVHRDIVYSLCQYGMGDVWEWGAQVGGNCWRTTGDIEDTWESMAGIGFGQAGQERFAAPGHWNDPDMLVVGWVGWGPQLHPTRLTPHEQMTHITLWSLLCAPLLIGCDMARLDEFTLSLLTNDEVLDVHQDSLGRQAARIAKRDDLEIWAKDLSDGSKAVGLFNRGEKEANVTVTWQELGLGGKQVVRDVWRQTDTGTFETGYGVGVARHGCALLRISKER
jgi:alpha-galactosidase